MIRPVLFGVVIAARIPSEQRERGVWSACAAGCFTLRLALQCRHWHVSFGSALTRHCLFSKPALAQGHW